MPIALLALFLCITAQMDFLLLTQYVRNFKHTSHPNQPKAELWSAEEGTSFPPEK